LRSYDLIAIAHICRQVQGMPLGILLAAAWMGILSPAEITAEISRGLDFLETDWHDLPERQRNLHAVFGGSWNLLTEREREVFQALALFRGGFTREAAQKVAGASLHDLKALADKSLLQYVPSGRYEIHGLLRQYAAEKLDSSPDVRAVVGNRHCAYYTAALEQWEADLTGSRQQVATVEMEAESANIDAAWYWAVERAQIERLAQSMEGLAIFYWLRGRYKEGEAATQAAVSTLAAAASSLSSTSSDNLRLWIRALVWCSDFCRKLGRRERVVQLHRQAMGLLEGLGLAGQTLAPSLPQDIRFERALLLQSMGRAVFMSDYERGRQLHEEALALFRELDDRWRMASALDTLGRAAYHAGSPGEAQQHLAESLALYQHIGDQLGIARSMANLSLVALYEGHFEEAERLARKAIDTLRQHGSRSDLTYGLDVLGSALEGAGKFGAAHAVLNEALAIHTELGQRHYLAFSHAPLSRIHLHLGQYQEAQTHAQTGLANAREADIKFAVGHTLSVLGCVALAQGAYAEAHTRLQESVTVYRVIGHWDDLSQAHTLLGCAARGLGDLRLAREYLVEALLLAARSRSPLPLLWALPVVALILADEAQVERPVELYALASRYPFVSKSCWFQDVVEREISDTAATLPLDALAAIEERGRAQDLGVTAEELLAEIKR
jgi:tetratricopeptide (TPR) repeat protein